MYTVFDLFFSVLKTLEKTLMLGRLRAGGEASDRR